MTGAFVDLSWSVSSFIQTRSVKFMIKKESAQSTIVEIVTPECVDFGNTSAPSIPISLSFFLGEKNIKNKKFIFCGFGSGLSWSSVYINLKKAVKIEHTRLKKPFRIWIIGSLIVTKSNPRSVFKFMR